MRKTAKTLCIVLALALVLALGLPATAADEEAAPAVQLSTQSLDLDGKAAYSEKYNIDGYNYFKLRDLAALLSGTKTQFDVSFDEAAMTAAITTGTAYTPVGGEQETGADNSATCVKSEWKLTVDGKAVDAGIYNLGGYNYFKLRDLAEVLGFTVDYNAESDAAIVSSDPSVVIWVNDSVTMITDETFDKYFEGTAAEGVEALLNAGKFYVNGLKVPASADETSNYQVNWVNALYKENDNWGVTVHKTIVPATMPFDEARLMFVQALTQVRGHVVKIYLDENGHAEKIDANHYDSVILNDIFPNNESTTIKRGDFALETNRVRYDVDNVQFATKDFDQDARVGDVGLYWYGVEDGVTVPTWHLERATPIQGKLVMDFTSGTYASVNGSAVRIESNINRYCLMDSGRPHQFYLMTYDRLGLNELEAIVWTTPTGHLAAFTFADSKAALTLAIENAKALKERVVVSEDGEDVSFGKSWVPQAAMDEYDAAIAAAEAVLKNNATSKPEFDWAVYQLGQAVGQTGGRASGFLGAMGEGKGGTVAVIPHEPQPRQKTSIDDASYSYLFKEDTAEAGIRAIIAAGGLYINGLQVPADEAALEADYPDGYTINGSVVLKKGGYENYDDAAYALINQFKGGVEILVSDTDGDGYADKLEGQILKGMIAGTLTDNGDGTYTVVRAGQSVTDLLTETDGRLFDDEDFTGESGEIVKKANLDESVKEGDMVLFYYGPDGIVMERAAEAKGILVFGADHDHYQIDEANYPDEMGFSRNNIIISNRPGEVVSAHEYFGFLNNGEGLTVSLWLVPTPNSEISGAPVGFTTGESAEAFLTSAIAQAKAKLESVVVSEDGSDVEAEKDWVTQAVYDELDGAIKQAESVLAADASSTEMDYQVYRLYLVLNGSGDDIGARFSGWAYEGFDKQINNTAASAEALLKSLRASEDGRDVSVDAYWVSQETLDALAEAAEGGDAEALSKAVATAEAEKELGYLLKGWDGDFTLEADTNNGIYIADATGAYFEGDGSELAVYQAIEKLLNDGKVSVNGFVIPAEEPAEGYKDQLDEDGRYIVLDLNGFRGLWYDTGLKLDLYGATPGTQNVETVSKWTWQGHDKLRSDKGYATTKGVWGLQVPLLGDQTEEDYRAGGFEFARNHFVLAVSMMRGNTTKLLAAATEDGGRTDTAAEIVFEVKSACQVEQMTDNDDGTTTIVGVPVDATSYNTDGGPNDKEPRTLKTANIASDVGEGDTALYWREADGEWYMERCRPVQGTLEFNPDGDPRGSNYDIGLVVDGEKTVYCDALITRFNMQAGSRPGQVLGEVKTLELTSVPVTLWFKGDSGYVVGLGHTGTADEALALAIENVGKWTAELKISADGANVAADAQWVTQEALDAFQAKLDTAKELKDSEATDAQKDAALYDLSSAYTTLLRNAQAGTKA